MPLVPLPLADLATIIKVLFFLAMFIAWLVRSIGESQDAQQARKRAQQREQRKAKRPNVDPMAEPALAEEKPFAQANAGAGREAVAQAGRGEKAVRDEVDEFLRQAAAPAAAKEKQPAARQRPARARGGERPRRIELIDDAPEPQPEKPRRLVDREPQPERPKQEARREERLKPKQQTARLTPDPSPVVAPVGPYDPNDISQTDERLEARLAKTFDHRLGKLDDGNDPHEFVRKEEAPMAAEIAEMLKSPTGVRQALILNEILARPIDRW